MAHSHLNQPVKLNNVKQQNTPLAGIYLKNGNWLFLTEEEKKYKINLKSLGEPHGLFLKERARKKDTAHQQST